MLTNVHSNSIESYHKDKRLYQDKNAILSYSLKHRHFTTTMVSVAINRPQSTLRSKIDQLLASGDLVKELDSYPCEVTGNKAQYYYNPKFSTQIRLL